jgi:hypothetical protein
VKTAKVLCGANPLFLKKKKKSSRLKKIFEKKKKEKKRKFKNDFKAVLRRYFCVGG